VIVRAVQGLDHREHETQIGAQAENKAMGFRMDRENYDFLYQITKKERSYLSQAVQHMVNRGKLLLSDDKYKKRVASLGRIEASAGSLLVYSFRSRREFWPSTSLKNMLNGCPEPDAAYYAVQGFRVWTRTFAKSLTLRETTVRLW
jgi:hypothetical protein